jgi:hypothetical protein
VFHPLASHRRSTKPNGGNPDPTRARRKRSNFLKNGRRVKKLGPASYIIEADGGKILEYLRGDDTPQSGLMFAARMTLAHFSVFGDDELAEVGGRV